MSQPSGFGMGRKREKAKGRAQKKKDDQEAACVKERIMYTLSPPYVNKSRDFLFGLLERGWRYDFDYQLFQEQYDIMDETWRGIVGQVADPSSKFKRAIELIDEQYDIWQVSVKKIFSIKRRAARRTCSFCGKEVPTSEPALSVCECLAVPAAAPKSPVTDDPPPRNVRVVTAAAPRPRVSTECPRRSRGGAAAPCLYGMSTS